MPDSRHFFLCVLLLVFGCLCSNGYAQGSNDKGCPSIDLKVKITKADDKRIVEAEVSGASAPVYYIFYYPSGKLVEAKRDVTVNKIVGIKPGTYYCSISDRNGCTKKIEFKVD